LAGGRPSKPLSLVKGHRTKAEKEVREKAEASLITGIRMQEWEEVSNNPAAHQQFRRMKKLYAKIGKDDALYEAPINRYCMIHAEVIAHEARIAKVEAKWDEAAEEANAETVLELTASYLQSITKLEANLMARRKMLLDIEKESATTLASALRSIPKKPQETEKDDPMEAYLKRKQQG